MGCHLSNVFLIYESSSKVFDIGGLYSFKLIYKISFQHDGICRSRIVYVCYYYADKLMLALTEITKCVLAIKANLESTHYHKCLWVYRAYTAHETIIYYALYESYIHNIINSNKYGTLQPQ